MSATYSIACRQCRKHLWIAQANNDLKILYTGQPKTMEAFKDFLFEHSGHPLLFGENCEGEIGEMRKLTRFSGANLANLPESSQTAHKPRKGKRSTIAESAISSKIKGKT